MADSVPALTNDETKSEPGTYKVHWFRSTIFQILVVGGVFFCGMYNALSALGAGGLATPWYANATSAAGYVFMAFFCLIGGIIVSKIGVRAALLISSTGDVIYAGSLYLNSKNGTQWFLMFGSIVSGCTDGLMYTVEGPIITAYPEPDRRGRMLGLWVFMRNLAPVIGGAIIFGLNHSTDSTGGVSLKTYLVIIGIIKVQRRDGVKIVMRQTGWKQTMIEWYKVVSSPDILLLCPLFFCSWFSGTLQTQYMNVRTRSLCAFVSIKQRARWSFIGLMVINLALWVWTAIITKQLEVRQPVIDWTSPMFGRTFALFFLFDWVTMATQTALYWIISQMSDDFIALSYMTGTLRGVECIGQRQSHTASSRTTRTDWLSVGLNIGFIVVSLPFAWFEKIKFALAEDETDEPKMQDEKEKEVYA
ncbi:hypothetical protein C8J56DRAFT_956479 [Mycena floridula]|nr:hypothetical protein C8J56DRAFT_956479 [Mycena floridula]